MKTAYHALRPIVHLLLLSYTVATVGAAEIDLPRSRQVQVAPPTPPPTIERSGVTSAAQPKVSGTTLYSIGSPTDEEQQYVEYINRARANPPAEGQRLKNTTDERVLSAYQFFSVDTNLMASQFNAIAAAPPLSINAAMMAAARKHSADMYTNRFQGHDSSNGNKLGARLANEGYSFTTAGENVFAAAESVFHGHAGFEVDWGSGPGGMQTPPGHRNSIHSAAFRELGVGIVNGVVVSGTNQSIGPQVVTQDFASRSTTPYITGVVYHDLNSNNFYDVGEGLSGISVSVPGSTFRAVTAHSGGYSVPVTTNGTYQVIFSGPGLPNVTRTAVVTGSQNVKLDLVPAYVVPVVVGPGSAPLYQGTVYSVANVVGATAYQWSVAGLAPYTVVEGAEGPLTNVTIAATSGYAVVDTAVVYRGSRAFHLAHAGFEDQIITFHQSIRVNSTSQLTFASRLGWATAAQVARAQVSTNDGGTWVDVWSRPGTDGSGQTAFVPQSVSLAAYAGREVRFRFNYDYTGGSIFTQTSTGVGWYLDDITVTDAQSILTPVITEVAGSTNYTFTPTVAGDYLLRARARAVDRIFPFGPGRLITAGGVTVAVQIISGNVSTGGAVRIEFQLNSGSAANFTLQMAPTPLGPWSNDAGATIEVVAAGVRYRALSSASGVTQRYYRISAN